MFFKKMAQSTHLSKNDFINKYKLKNKTHRIYDGFYTIYVLVIPDFQMALQSHFHRFLNRVVLLVRLLQMII
jgi:hypothetical protein